MKIAVPRMKRVAVTLIELLVTVVILSILAAISITSYVYAIDRARAVADQASVRVHGKK